MELRNKSNQCNEWRQVNKGKKRTTGNKRGKEKRTTKKQRDWWNWRFEEITNRSKSKSKQTKRNQNTREIRKLKNQGNQEPWRRKKKVGSYEKRIWDWETKKAGHPRKQGNQGTGQRYRRRREPSEITKTKVWKQLSNGSSGFGEKTWKSNQRQAHIYLPLGQKWKKRRNNTWSTG